MLYPQEPGWKSTDTSRAAAVKVSTRAPSIRSRVWDALSYDTQLSGQAIADELKEYLYSVLPRLSEMQLDGLVRDSGRRGMTELGGEAIIWERVPDAVYHDRIRVNVKPRKYVKDWQIDKLREAVTLLSMSNDGVAMRAEKLLNEVLEPLYS